MTLVDPADGFIKASRVQLAADVVVKSKILQDVTFDREGRSKNSAEA